MEMSVKEASAAARSEGGEVEGVPGKVGGPEVVDVASEVMEVVPVVVAIAVGLVKAVPERQVEDEAAGPGPRREEQPQGGLAPQEGGIGATTTIYHARAVAGRLEGEEGPARAGADYLVGIVEEAALRSVFRFNEAELLRGLYSIQMEVTTLVGALLRKAGAAKLKTDEAKAQLAKLKKKSASWESAHTELPAKKLDEAQRASAVAVERHEEAISSNEEPVRQKDEADGKVGDLQRELEGERAKAVEEKGRLQRELEAERVQATTEKESLKKELEAEKAKAASERAALQKELNEERAKAASERATYPDLCVAVVEQFKGSAEFQTAVDAAVASSLAGQESGEAGPSRTTAGGRTEAEINEAWAKCV
ncbi:flagellar radial spoke protein 2-like [Camellia sinensis]|uniref:flagellar radial spoke protein 2-like n=1 Tax=Camellia sinensis TaxID=4442 RepID=UPI0010358508|nr:flagellar radial spoke protein 2-like [Camellia sinensis]